MNWNRSLGLDPELVPGLVPHLRSLFIYVNDLKWNRWNGSGMGLDLDLKIENEIPNPSPRTEMAFLTYRYRRYLTS